MDLYAPQGVDLGEGGSLDRLVLRGYQTYAVRGLNVVSERLFIQPMLWGEPGCIYYRQGCLPIGFAWLCERCRGSCL